MADSQILRWIDELNGVVDSEERARAVKAEIRRMKKEPTGLQARRAIRSLYNDLDEIQFKPDYMCLIIDREKDYHRACKGFCINGIRYARLVGTVSGVKASTIVFVSERLVGELRKRIDNGRDTSVPIVPAKLEAYRALTCSASVPVSMPHGVIVVDECETEFTDDVLYLTDDGDGEPKMEYRRDELIKLDASDGYGIMLPSLAERWSSELRLDYTVSGLNTRCAFEKGMVFTFDFLDFAENVAHSYIIKDAWDDERDLRDAELILTTSMLKLWNAYPNCEAYLAACEENHYSFGIPKTCPKELESKRTLNYQFIQSYHLDDEDIEELITPTVEEIHGVLGKDWRKTVLFAKGAFLNEDNVLRVEDDYVKALMVDHDIIDDPFIQKSIYALIKKRIDDAKIGCLNVHGNYSIISGDPYGLCQSMFGLPVTGLLKAGEIYCRFWSDLGTKELACFRAPMTSHNNIRRVHPVADERMQYWYRYMSACTILNSWDTITIALNGCDFDGDSVFLTDNHILVDRLIDLPAVMCAQRNATKIVPDEDILIASNIASFGNDIGKITNRITSMFEVQSHYEEDSPEYETLEYRIRCGQLLQQNVIDKSKGIIAKPMPREWSDRRAASLVDDDGLYLSIVADRKPYFMKYIYTDLSKQYNRYISNTTKSALREFDMSIDELAAIPEKEQTEEQKNFLHFYWLLMPVGMGDCVMNKICRRIEEEFDHCLQKDGDVDGFDYRVYKGEHDYTSSQYYSILNIFNEYNRVIMQYRMDKHYSFIDEYDIAAMIDIAKEGFYRDCISVCQSDDVLCDVLLDICYSRSSTKRFVWDMCSGIILKNLLIKNGYKMSFPCLDTDGELTYGGNTFSIHTISIEGEHNGTYTE